MSATYTITQKSGDWGTEPVWRVEYSDGRILELHGTDETDIQSKLSQIEADEAAEITANENEQTIRDALVQGLITLDTHITNISAPAPTAAEQKAALLFVLRSVKKLARLQLHMLDDVN